MRELSRRMKEALKALYENGTYELWELHDWDTWNALKGMCASIRTDTMKALCRRGLAKDDYDKRRGLYKWHANITPDGVRLIKGDDSHD